MQQGGSQYGVPRSEMTPTYAGPSAAPRPHMLGIPTTDQPRQPPAEAAPPISSRPPAPAVSQISNIDELAPAVEGNYAEEDDAIAAGEEAERGVPAGNRWPRQETLALLKIRSEMDAAFRDITPKAPLWEGVSRKLAEMGYNRSAKKCKEKFENVHKYYKRTKDKSGGRQDGKSYRFFSQLEALNNNSTSSAAATTLPPPTTTTSAFGSGMGGRAQHPAPITSLTPSTSNQPPPQATAADCSTPPAGSFNFSSNSSSSTSSSETEGEDTEEGVALEKGQRKRKRPGGDGSGRKMRNFFKGLMHQVLERQEAMQARFLETIERRENDRMIREEAWKRQEMARLNREHDINVQERAMAATRDQSIIEFLQKITRQSSPLLQSPASMAIVSPPVAVVPQPALPQQQPPTAAPQVVTQPSPKHKQPPPPVPAPAQQGADNTTPRPPPVPRTTATVELVAAPVQEPSSLPPELGSAGGNTDPASSRWPKVEVHALIKIRSEMDPRYQETGPKGPLWEEISSAMRRMGYNRSAKRCKEKWENINKYFKKVKESSKKRPEDSKTCPYFHQLDELYRRKILVGGGGQQEPRELVTPEVLPIRTLPPPAASTQQQAGNEGKARGGNNETCVASATNGGGHSPTFPEEGAGNGAAGQMKKPEDIVKQLMGRDYGDVEENSSDSVGVDDEDEDEEQQKMAYKMEFQRPNMGGTPNTGGNASVPATTTTTTRAASSFLAMVK